jgi:hypothetical protein
VICLPDRVVLAILAMLAWMVVGCRRSDTSAVDSAAAAAQTQPPSPWTVSDSGAAVLRIGMTRDELARDLPGALPARASADSGCAYLDIRGIPAGIRTMWVAGTLARIEILSPELPTDRGARVGDSKARIDSLYGSRAATMPAKYDPNGSYIVVRPASTADSSRRIVFETDSTGRVTRYRAGREPEVEWVEGCS